MNSLFSLHLMQSQGNMCMRKDGLMKEPLIRKKEKLLKKISELKKGLTSQHRLQGREILLKKLIITGLPQTEGKIKSAKRNNMKIFIVKKMKTKTIRQSVSFSVSPHEVFEALMDEKKHSAFTGGGAKVSRKVGGSFSIFGGALYGKNLELEKDKKIVQEWYCEDTNWPKGHFSKLTFVLKKSGAGCKLEMIHEKVPEGAFKSISQGWKDHYWEPMKKFFREMK